MSDTTYDVRVWSVEKRKRAKATTYRLRWVVSGEVHSEHFPTAKLADSFRASLVKATREGEPFDRTSGLPTSAVPATRVGRTWVQVAREFVDTKWEDASPRHRRSTAEGLTTLTCALVRDNRTPPNARALRDALMHWEFNTGARAAADEPPETHREAVRWIADNSLPVRHLNDLDGVKSALHALSLNLDGSKAKPSTVSRKRAALSGALNYATEKNYLDHNLLGAARKSAKRKAVSESVDPRAVVNPTQARALLNAVKEIHPPLYAYFASLYYAALRPAEGRNLRENDLTLPLTGWGSLLLHKGYQQAGTAWTDSGERGEERELKHRSEDDTRPVPAHPDLVAAFRWHIDEYGTGVEGRLFVTRTARGGHPIAPPFQNPASMSTVYRVWDLARAKALTPQQYTSPLAGRPYDLRHACVSTWLSAGVDATQVAKWAGHSVAVLLKVYAACLDDQEQAAMRRIAARLDPPTSD
jgi:integrase